MPEVMEPRTPVKSSRFTLPRVKRGPPRPRPDHCLNCGHAAEGNFCAHCGQEHKDHAVALRPLVSDLLAEVVSWDSKLMRTLVPLVIRPGFLTSEYTAGRRVGYLSPPKLYLTVSVLFFLVLSWKAAPTSKDTLNISPTSTAFSVKTGAAPPTALHYHSMKEYDASQMRKPPAKRDPPAMRTLIHHLFKANQNPQAFISAILDDFPKMMFLLLPLFAMTLKLLYLRTKRLYVEHLIFLLHVHAFAFLILAPLMLVSLIPHIGSARLERGLFVGLVLPVYVALAMRAVYKQGWHKTLTKFVLLGLGYVVLLVLCFTGTALVALWLL